jgi:hypothetical protein
MLPEEASAEETVAVRRGETAEDDGLTTWKRYSLLAVSVRSQAREDRCR